MNALFAIGASVIGVGVAYLSLSLTGLMAASDLYLSLPNKALYSALTIALPPILSAAIGGILLSRLSLTRRFPILVAYFSAVAAFILIMAPSDGSEVQLNSGMLAYWDIYLYLLVLPIGGWFLANKAKQEGTP